MEIRILPVALLSAILMIVSVKNSSGQRCLKANNENGLPDSQGTSSGLKSVILPLQHQAIIPSYKFQCCGTISEWAISIANNGNDTMDVLSLQVWRPSPSVNETGCYNLVGNNNFSSVSLGNELTLVTPLPHERIQFQPGDVLGFYVENGLQVEYGGVLMLCDLNEEGDRGYETEEVWYATNLVFSNANCLAAVGPGRLLDSSTNVAPIISVSYTAADYCTSYLPIAATTTQTQSTHSGTAMPTQSPTEPTASNLLPPPLVGADYPIIVGVALAVFVIAMVTLVAVVAVGVKVRRDQAKGKVSLVGSGAYVTPLLDMPTHPTESVGT